MNYIVLTAFLFVYNFQVPAAIHDHVLGVLLESDPETLDYVLKKKAAQTSLARYV